VRDLKNSGWLTRDGEYMNRYTIVGFGCAGYSAARAIRQADQEGEIHVFESTNNPPANPMLTTYYASDRLTYDNLFPFGGLQEIVRELNLEFHGCTRVKRILAAEKQLEQEDGSRIGFDTLLISTGARAVLPGLKGLPSGRVFLMRTMGDAQHLKDYLEARPVRKAVVVGASMAGMKVAELLHRRGVETTVVDIASHLFPLAAFENVAREIERRISSRGIHFRWNTALEEITSKGVRFTDGRETEADVICPCVGTRANVELVANTDVVAGQPIAIKHGIVVNQRMETSLPGIYAAGDCCEGTDMQTGETSIIGLWENAGQQGETAGKNMAGRKTEYRGNILHNIIHFMDMDFIGLGDNRLRGDTASFGNLNEGTYIQAVIDGGALRCLNIIGNSEISGILKSYFMKQLAGGRSAVLPVAQRVMLMRNGLSETFISKIAGERK
jgi:NADPH-dependent 2,4-dienoyl-CoA reductase/sulfur reductase-like enzyme